MVSQISIFMCELAVCNYLHTYTIFKCVVNTLHITLKYYVAVRIFNDYCLCSLVCRRLKPASVTIIQ